MKSVKINTRFLSDGRFQINAFVNDEAKPSVTFVGEKNTVSRMFNQWAAELRKS